MSSNDTSFRNSGELILSVEKQHDTYDAALVRPSTFEAKTAKETDKRVDLSEKNTVSQVTNAVFDPSVPVVSHTAEKAAERSSFDDQLKSQYFENPGIVWTSPHIYGVASLCCHQFFASRLRANAQALIPIGTTGSGKSVTAQAALSYFAHYASQMQHIVKKNEMNTWSLTEKCCISAHPPVAQLLIPAWKALSAFDSAPANDNSSRLTTLSVRRVTITIDSVSKTLVSAYFDVCMAPRFRLRPFLPNDDNPHRTAPNTFPSAFHAIQLLINCYATSEQFCAQMGLQQKPLFLAAPASSAAGFGGQATSASTIDFDELSNELLLLGFERNELQKLWASLTALILLLLTTPRLGSWQSASETDAELSLGAKSPDYIEDVCTLLQLPFPDAAERLRLTLTSITVQDQRKTLSKDRIRQNKEAAARWLYNYVVSCILTRLNAVCGGFTQDDSISPDRPTFKITVIDSPGFRNQDVINGLEQLFVNYIAEKMEFFRQKCSTEDALTHDEFRFQQGENGATTALMEHPRLCVNFFEGSAITTEAAAKILISTSEQPPGALELLSAVSSLVERDLVVRDDAFFACLLQTRNRSRNYLKLLQLHNKERTFIIQHTWGKTSYSVKDFTVQDADLVTTDLAALLAASPVLCSLRNDDAAHQRQISNIFNNTEGHRSKKPESLSFSLRILSQSRQLFDDLENNHCNIFLQHCTDRMFLETPPEQRASAMHTSKPFVLSYTSEVPLIKILSSCLSRPIVNISLQEFLTTRIKMATYALAKLTGLTEQKDFIIRASAEEDAYPLLRYRFCCAPSIASLIVQPKRESNALLFERYCREYNIRRVRSAVRVIQTALWLTKLKTRCVEASQAQHLLQLNSLIDLPKKQNENDQAAASTIAASTPTTATGSHTPVTLAPTTITEDPEIVSSTNTRHVCSHAMCAAKCSIKQFLMDSKTHSYTLRCSEFVPCEINGPQSSVTEVFQKKLGETSSNVVKKRRFRKRRKSGAQTVSQEGVNAAGTKNTKEEPHLTGATFAIYEETQDGLNRDNVDSNQFKVQDRVRDPSNPPSVHEVIFRQIAEKTNVLDMEQQPSCMRNDCQLKNPASLASRTNAINNINQLNTLCRQQVEKGSATRLTKISAFPCRITTSDEGQKNSVYLALQSGNVTPRYRCPKTHQMISFTKLKNLVTLTGKTSPRTLQNDSSLTASSPNPSSYSADFMEKASIADGTATMERLGKKTIKKQAGKFKRKKHNSRRYHVYLTETKTS